ncbi:hypothetical protein [Aeromicrobium sp.]|uniref:hypothetical protein n=1 Tax=Aeromicrobium sp. TaxID=1871063 RepID=UPI0030BFA6CE
MSETSHGFGRVLVAIYAVFALAASARSIFQLATKAGEAPFAYSMSALAGLVYVIATIALARSHRGLALITISVELIGVLVTGVLSLLDESLFQDQTVWSGFGEGYGFIPLVLPILGLWWLRRTASSRQS